MRPMAILYVIATPIGNLEDISPRALRLLGEVDLVLCEDTRVTKKLLAHYHIKKETVSYHSHSSKSKHDFVKQWFRDGKSAALVSDAGTPAISDPGSMLIRELRENFSQEQLSIIAVPGASALSAALSVSGLPVSEFTFLGFLPHKKGRETLFREIAESFRTIVFYESPHRIMKTLKRLSEVLDVTRVLVVSRELSKIYEETVSDSPLGVLSYFERQKEKQRGEFVIMVSGKK